MTHISRILLLVLCVLNSNVILMGQNCHSSDGNISLNYNGSNEENGFKHIYLLTNQNGLIIQLKSSFSNPLFIDVPPGSYLIYAINYKEDSNISGLYVGSDVRSIQGECMDKTIGFPYNVCQNSTECNAPDGNITLFNVGYNYSSEFQQSYILTNRQGTILEIKNQQINHQPLFSNLDTGTYLVYALNYKRANQIINLNQGKNIDSIYGTCLDKKGPLIFNVCKEICDNGIDDDNDGQIDCADSNCPEVCPCDLSVKLSPLVYDNGNTPENIKDDTFSFEADIKGQGSLGWEGGGKSGQYGFSTLFGPYPVDSLGVGFQIRDKVDKNCFTSISANMSSCIYLKTCTCCKSETRSNQVNE